ncbi:AAA family ATPase [Persicobacter psychrovividus]|uniref:AAA ATPase-like protein n=1 Tax=Persicobacter psychrovividus TaxID=387638 RepID=A0ABM7VDW6_9BACT|nr:hypothetical protein PEPS_11450 [Persicobacter psychrovividus]
MKHIKRLGLQNFRGFANQAFDFSKLNILTGTNSSGKSSVFKALLLLQQSAHKSNFNELNFEGEHHNLGTFQKVLNRNAPEGDDNIGFELVFDYHSISQGAFFDVEKRELRDVGMCNYPLGFASLKSQDLEKYLDDEDLSGFKESLFWEDWRRVLFFEVNELLDYIQTPHSLKAFFQARILRPEIVARVLNGVEEATFINLVCQNHDIGEEVLIQGLSEIGGYKVMRENWQKYLSIPLPWFEGKGWVPVSIGGHLNISEREDAFIFKKANYIINNRDTLKVNLNYSPISNHENGRISTFSFSNVSSYSKEELLLFTSLPPYLSEDPYGPGGLENVSYDTFTETNAFTGGHFNFLTIDYEKFDTAVGCNWVDINSFFKLYYECKSRTNYSVKQQELKDSLAFTKDVDMVSIVHKKLISFLSERLASGFGINRFSVQTGSVASCFEYFNKGNLPGFAYEQMYDGEAFQGKTTFSLYDLLTNDSILEKTLSLRGAESSLHEFPSYYALSEEDLVCIHEFKEKLEEVDVLSIMDSDFITFVNHAVIECVKYLPESVPQYFKLEDQRDLMTYLPAYRGNNARIYMNSSNSALNKLLGEFKRGTALQEANDYVNKWLKAFGIGEKCTIRSVEGIAYKVEVENSRGDVVDIADLGYGISQLLPVILKIALAPNYDEGAISNSIVGQVILIEEPETNLHPRLQSILADMLVEAYLVFGIQIMIETHSEYLIRRLQVLMKKGFASIEANGEHPSSRLGISLTNKPQEKELASDDVMIHYVSTDEEGETSAYKIKIGNNGVLSKDFGSGFFDEATRLEIETIEMGMLYTNIKD